MNAKTSLLLIVMLVSIYGLTHYFSTREKPPLQTELIVLDTSQVSAIHLHLPQQADTHIRLQREQTGWIASNGRRHVRALQPPIDALLNTLQRVSTMDVLATRPEQWAEYGLEEEQATRVSIFVEHHLQRDFLVNSSGSEDGLAWLRFVGEAEVYAVIDLQVALLQRPFRAYRPTTLLSVADQAKIERFEYILPDTVLAFGRRGAGWQLNDSLDLDPARVNRYLQGLRNVQGEHFADDFDDKDAADLRLHSLLLQVAGQDQPLLINVYLDSMRQLPYVLHSNQNPSAWFGADSLLVYQRLFQSTDYFLGVEE